MGDAGPQGAAKEDTNISSAEMVYGLPLILPEQLFFFLCFFVLQRAFLYFLCTVSGCDGGNRTHNIAVYAWRFSPLSYDRHLY